MSMSRGHRILYHLGDLFANNLQRGLADACAQSGVRLEMVVEQMDSNRVRAGKPYLATLAELLRVKYGGTSDAWLR